MQNKNKKTIIIMVVFIIMLVVVVPRIGEKLARHELSKEAKDLEKIIAEERCHEVRSSVLAANCYLELAKNKEDERYCEKIKLPHSPEVKDSCYVYVAKLKDDSSLCENVKTVMMSRACRDYFKEKDSE